MSICKLMISDFMGVLYPNSMPLKKGEKYYDVYHLECGIAYCKGLLEEGFEEEPFYEFDLSKFIKWAENKLARR